MDEDQILQSIIADPDVVDPTIDVSRLRKTTETSPRLLGGVTGIQGLKFDPTRTDYIRDLYSVYSGGLPTIDVAPVVDTTTSTVDTTTPTVDIGGGGGGMDQVIGDPVVTQPVQDLVDPSVDIAEVGLTGGLTPSGTFGDQPTFTTTPGTTIDNVTGDITNPDGTYGGNIVDEFAPTETPLDIREQASVDQYQTAPKDLSEEMSEVSLSPTQTDSLNVLARASNTIADFGKRVQDTLGGVFDAANNTIDVFGQKFNVAKTATGLALNKIAGGPASLVFDLLPQDSLADTTTRGIVNELKAEKNYGFNIQSGNLNQDPFGRNPVSAFGDYEGTLANDAVSTSTTKMGLAKKEFAQDYFNKKAVKAGGVEVDDGIVLGPGEASGELGNFITDDVNLVDEVTLTGEPTGGGETSSDAGFSAPTQTGQSPRGTTTGVGGDTDDFDDGTMTGFAAPSAGVTGVDSFFDAVDTVATGGGETSSDAGFSAPTQTGQSPRGTTTGGGSDSGGKIVCTMMNESYGFGSFRNKIWLRHSKDLAPEYQKGYHKIFLPLVRLSKKNKFLKKTLEHIAVHRTIDIRQESRGKVHPLGRVYRKILEPICYWVGKYAKR
jgi:hypothetical protein